MENSHIEWTTHTFNPWHGCAKVSPGCKNCYAESQHNFHYSSLKAQQGTCWGVGSPRLATSADNWKKPLKWNREAQAAGVRPRVFCASMADVFEEQSELSRSFTGQTAQVPSGPGKTRTVMFVDIAAERLKLLRLIYDTPHLDWLLLTKRPEHIVPALCAAVDMVEAAEDENAISPFLLWLTGWAVFDKAPANVWLGTSVENQEQADARIPHLLAAPAAVRFLSCEPLLGPLELFENRALYACQSCGELVGEGEQNNQACPHCGGTALDPVGVCEEDYDGINWVIVGGESGHGARPMHPLWAESLRDQCQRAGVAFHFKQWGEWAPVDQPHTQSSPEHLAKNEEWLNADGGHGFHGPQVWRMCRIGKHVAGRLLGGRTWDELPTVATSVPA